MSNLYEQTNSLLFIRDMVLLGNEDEVSDEIPLATKLDKLPKMMSFVDDDKYSKQPVAVKSTKNNSSK
jgi:hypothetical protein